MCADTLNETSEARVKRFVESAKRAIETGRLVEARKVLTEALAISPDNSAAHYYKFIIEEYEFAAWAREAELQEYSDLWYPMNPLRPAPR